MSDVVVSVVESETNVVVSEQDVAVDVTENVVQVSVSTAGIQGVPGANNDPVYVTVRNATGALLPKGSIVYVSGGNGTHTQVSLASAASDATSARTLGWLAADIANNADGLCMVEGYLDGVDTQGVTQGVQLYLSGTTPGAFTATKPVAPIHLVYVGVAVKASAGNGRVYVKVQNGYELNELHDVLIVSPTNNQVLAYDSATQLWKNATNAPDGVTSITATAPLTGGTITSTGSIGLDQTALSITKSQVSDFTSGTVTSAGTAQQAGTAVYAVNSGTAVYATTSGTATYSTNSGTAVYATTSGTAVTISGDITKSQVSDFTSGTVASAGTAQQAGTAVYAVNAGTSVYATNSGTAVFADNSGTAVFATNAGTAVFATNASTAVTISGSIDQSQVTNLVSDLANTAKTNADNTFANANTFNAGSTFNNFLSINSVGGNGAGSIFTTGEAGGLNKILIAGSRGNGGVVIGSSASVLDTPVLAVRGATTQNGNLTEWRSSSGTLFHSINSAGLVNGTRAHTIIQINAGEYLMRLRGAASQTGDYLQIQNSAATNLFRVDSAGSVFTGAQSITIPGTAGTNALRIKTTTNSVSNLANMRFESADGNLFDMGKNETSNQSGSFYLYTGSALPIEIYNGATKRIIVESTGNVNIGPTTGAGTARLSVFVDTATRVGQLIRGAASQSANLLELQNSAGVIQALVNPFGAASFGTSSVLGRVSVSTGSTGTIGQVIRGVSGQTANLQEWQSDTASILARIDSNGNLRANIVQTLGAGADLREGSGGGGLATLIKMGSLPGAPGANAGRLYFRDGTNAGTLKLVVRAGAAGAETTILDNIPQ